MPPKLLKELQEIFAEAARTEMRNTGPNGTGTVPDCTTTQAGAAIAIATHSIGKH